MSDFSDFYAVTDDITEHLRKDFIGPFDENEIIETEEPINRYCLGILFPQSKSNDKASITPDMEEELFEDNPEAEKTMNINVYKPSSMALSFNVNSEDILDIRFCFAVYTHYERIIRENGKEVNRPYYSREPKEFTRSIAVPNKVGNIDISPEKLPLTVYLHVRRINDDGTKLATVSVMNKNKAINKTVENNTTSLFQCRLSIRSKKGFMPVYTKKLSKSAEEKTGDMLYDDVYNYSYGHGCASVYKIKNDIVLEISSEFIPQYRMLQMMPRIFNDTDYFFMKYWKTADRYIACRRLSDFVSQYENWLEHLRNDKGIMKKYPETSEISFNNIERCIKRLRNGIYELMKNDIAWRSFKYMNEAMLLQRIHIKNCTPDTVSWYPFQMAYILQIIPDIVNSESPYRNDVDLLWFPTGGGKTEAYLGVSAFTIFYRRLSEKSDKKSYGVTVIMRYTLRILTLQQFERATALICACEYMRRKYNISEDEISIGLWIGSGMTPNHIKDAKETLDKLIENPTANLYEANPMQVTKCPWCGAEISLNGYSVENNCMNIRCCNNSDCDFKNHLPVYVVDDDIYEIMPTFLLSTVDKFARITWEERAGNIFGASGNKPPALIIQDELHLISGPLGSVTGIYEIAIDEICKYYGDSPKIIASTATVKNADNQIKVLYNRNMIQFPPNGLSYRDSFFAVEADKNKRPARTYLGICSIGNNSSEMLIKIFALLTFMKHLYIKQKKPVDVIDNFFTTVGYFNSLKELGTSSIIIMDRIFAEIKYLAAYKFKEEAEKYLISDGEKINIPMYLKNDELTSRNSAKEIKTVLDRLSVPFTNEICFDYIMASNMLSVGIDINRLGVMCVYGQPKSNAEYIQATSRVGRTNPGLVISLYNGIRSRDKSYYEQFDYYHRTFYNYVESTSVTSYSPRAIEKALHCAFVAIIRHTIPEYNSNKSACKFRRDDDRTKNIKRTILKRILETEPRIVDYAEEWLDYYLNCWNDLVKTLPNTLVFYDFRNEDVSLLRSAENNTGSEIPTTLNSVRNVEASADVYFTKR